MSAEERKDTVQWEPMRIAVRGHIVPSASQVRRRRENRGKRREAAKKRQVERDREEQEQGAHEDAQAAEKAASWQMLSPEEELEAIKILGPRPWLTVAYDGETVVLTLSEDGRFIIIDQETRLAVSAVPSYEVLRCGQPLRVGYYEVRGIDEWSVARRLRRGVLKPDDQHTLCEAGFVLPDAGERIALANGRLAPIYAGNESVLAADRKMVESYKTTHRYRGEYKEIQIRSKQDFIKRVLYRYCYGYGKRIIGARLVGHQLFYDLTRLVTDVITPEGDLIRGVLRGADWARRGFSLKLCDCPFEKCGYHPRIRVAKLGRFKMRYAFSKASIPGNGGGQSGTNRQKRTYTRRFLDTIPFGLSLRKCKSAKLEVMGKIFDAKVRKRPHPDFSGPMTPEFLKYLVTDVQATYWLLVAELEDYQELGLSRTPESIYSTASLAKTVMQACGFPRAKDRQWHLEMPALGYSAQDIQGFASTTYFGGRAEVGVRSQVSESIHIDFKSQYVAGSDLMGLQAYWLAKDVRARDATQEIRTWLTSKSPAELLSALGEKATWPRLPVLVQIRPDGRITLPVRADFQQNRPKSAGVKNIGQAYVRSKTPLWYTLGDLIAGIIRDKAVPEILQAVAFTPSTKQIETQQVTIADRTFDPRREVLWTGLINLRRERKREGKEAKARGDLALAGRLDGQQHALKETTLAGSYGVAEELNEKIYEGRALTLDVYALGQTRRHGNVVEEPGPYFAGVLGTCIPAAGRLLLAICERLLQDQGLLYVFMDTDSIVPIRPDGMSRAEFQRRVLSVVNYFLPLNVFAGGGSLLDYEDQNYVIDPSNPNVIAEPKRLERLYGVATSAKRYIEVNVQEKPETGEKRPIPRKFTSHGLGQWGRRDQEEYTLPAYMDPPHTFREKEDEHGKVVKDAEGNPVRIPESADLGGPLWVYRLQWDFAYTMLNGHYPNGEPLYVDEEGVPWYYPQAEEWLDVPAFYHFSVETWADYQRVKHLPGMRPGGFITVYPSPRDTRDPLSQIVVGDEVVRPDEAGEVGQDTRDDAEEAVAEQLEEVLAEMLLSRQSTALYSPYVTSGAEAAGALLRGEIRRIGDNKVVPAETELKSMYAVVLHYFIHGEAKAEHPYGVGELARRHIEVTGLDIIGKESNRLAQSAAEDTANLVGGREQFGGRDYGPTISEVTPRSANKPDKTGKIRPTQHQLSSLFDEEMPDLLAASCLSRRTIERMARSQNEAQPETWAALELAMKLLDPSNSDGIAGWREVVTVEELAQLLDTTCQEAQDRLKGRKTWTESERAQLSQYLEERRLRQAQSNP